MKESLKRFFGTYGDLQVSLKSWFIFILASLILVDFVIVLNIPFVRPICGFLFFTTIPGLLIIYALRLGKIGTLKTGVMAVGLSLLFLIFAGLFFNGVYSVVGITNPLSVPYLLPSLSFALFLFAIVAYRLNKDDRPFVTIPNLPSLLNANGCLPLLLIPSLFPFLAIAGTYLMNTQQNNSLLVALFLLIPLYVVALVILQRRRDIAPVVFPVTIVLISSALLLTVGLTSNYLVGADVQGEYLVYQQVVSSQHWIFVSNVVASDTIGTSLLPAVYQLITGINGVYMFKLVFQLILSVTPLVVYIIARKYLTAIYAFLASFLFMAQLQFIVNIQSSMAEETALLFFALAFMVLLADDLKAQRKTLLFLSFATGAILTHYTTSGILILVLLIANGIAVAIAAYYRFARRDDARKLARPVITFTMIVILFAIYFLWYNQLAQATNVTGFLRVTVSHFSQLFILNSRNPGVLEAVGQNIVTLPQRVRDYTDDLLYVIIGIGVLVIFFKRETKLYGNRYAFLALASGILAVLWLVIPYLSVYGIARLLQLLLVLLAVPFFIGVFAILKKLKITRQRYLLSVVLLILLVQFACSSLLLDQAFGVPNSIVLNRSGTSWDEYYIYNQEVIAAQWLKNNAARTSTVAADGGGGLRLEVAQFQQSNVISFGAHNSSAAPYVYLSYANVLGNFSFVSVSNITHLTTQSGYTSGGQVSNQVASLLSAKSKIYDNGKSTIYT
ncbi:MAG: DUF2206 domain-containing protein [Halobacteriota archaeon]|jgi:uncharacterized membrane protein